MEFQNKSSRMISGLENHTLEMYLIIDLDVKMIYHQRIINDFDRRIDLRDLR